MNVSYPTFKPIISQQSVNKDSLNKPQNTKCISFRHHPDFEILSSVHQYPLSSLYFRRGNFIDGVEATKDFPNVINALTSYFKQLLSSNHNFADNKVKMFIGGVARSQEPFSLLAVIKSLIGMKKLDDILDLHTVDLLSQPCPDQLLYDSYCDTWVPRYAKTSFIEDNGENHGIGSWMRYRVNDEIFDYVSKIYNNKNNAKWEQRIQDVVKEYSSGSFDIISVNNTLLYIKRYNNELDTVIENIYRILKPGGIFITDNDRTLDCYKNLCKIFNPENSVEIYPGIYKKG